MIKQLMNKVLALLNNFYFKIVFKFLIFITFLFYIYYNVDFNILQSKIDIENINFFAFFIIYLFFLFGLLLSIFRWQYLLNLSEDINKESSLIKINQIVQSILYSNLISDIGFLASFVVRTIIGIQNTLKLNKILSTFFIEKIMSSLSLIILFCISTSILFFFNKNFFFNEFFIIYYLSLFFLFVSGICIFLINNYINFFKKFFSKFFILNYFSVYLNAYKLLKPMILSIMIQLLRILTLTFIPFFLGIEISFINYFFYLPIIMFVASITFTINKWGFREAVFIFFYSLVGMSSETIFIISITFGILSIIASSTHLIFYEIWIKFLYRLKI